MSDATRTLLTDGGWRKTQGGGWIHPALAGGANGRRRVFTTAEALTLATAEPCPECGAYECTDRQSATVNN